jgi:hypothetical protein
LTILWFLDIFPTHTHMRTYEVERTLKPDCSNFSILTSMCSPGLPKEAMRTWQVIGLLCADMEGCNRGKLYTTILDNGTNL